MASPNFSMAAGGLSGVPVGEATGHILIWALAVPEAISQDVVTLCTVGIVLAGGAIGHWLTREGVQVPGLTEPATKG